MDKSYKLIAFDMDGTLLNTEKKISRKTAAAIKDASEHGKVIVLSTGRGLAELVEFLPDLQGVRYLICVSGGYIYDTVTQGFIYSNPLSDENIKSILKISRQEETMIQMLSDLSVAAKKDLDRLEDFHMGVYRPLYERVCTIVEDMYEYYKTQKPQIAKLNLYHTSVEARERTFERLSKLNIEAVRSEITSTECSSKGVTKGTGLLKLCEYLGISVEETIAVGDADNDIEILKTAGLSIAMGNARESVKAIADVIVSDNDHDGCVEAIYQYLYPDTEAF